MLENLTVITIRVPKLLRDDLLKLSIKNRRSLSSFCRIIIEDNYKNFGKNHWYDSLKYNNENLIPLSFTLSKTLKEDIIARVNSFYKPHYKKITTSDYLRKVLSDSKK